MASIKSFRRVEDWRLRAAYRCVLFVGALSVLRIILAAYGGR